MTIGSLNSGRILLSDSTLRDGSHAIRHQLTTEFVTEFCSRANQTGVSWVEVGHGNGLGASSYQLGLSQSDDWTLLKAARESLSIPKLSVHVMPGISTFDRDILPAIEVLGVDIFRVAAHFSEADTTAKHIEKIVGKGKTAIGVLMMVHRSSPEVLVKQSGIMRDSGAEAVMLMDSAGAMRMSDVRELVGAVAHSSRVPVGFHAHNNLGLAVANSLVALESGATILDGCAGGLGAGAGNAPMELLISLVGDLGLTDAQAERYFQLVDWAMGQLGDHSKAPSTGSIATGLAGLFSGFLLPVQKIALEYGVSEYKLIQALSKYRPVAGQEDLIIELAERLSLEN